MEVEQSHSTYSLRRALLIYSDGSEESVVTEHPVVSGVIQPGKPVDLEATLRALSAPSEKAKAASPIKWSASPRLVAEIPEYVVWWSPAKVRPVFIAGKPGKAWTPPLIWCAKRKAPTCYLFAFEGEDPTAETIVYQPAFGPTGGLNHVHADSRICVGTSRPGNFTPPEWERSFWDSNFKTDGGLKSIKPYAIHKTFKKIGTLELALDRIQAHRSPTG